MSRKNGESSNLVLALIVLLGVGGALGVSSLNVKVSVIGAIIVTAAVLESAIILGGIALLSRRQRHLASTGDSN